MTQTRHGHRADLLDEHPWGDVGQIVLASFFLSVWIADTFFLRYTTFLSSHVSLNLRIAVGIANALVAAYLALTSMKIVFGETREPPQVIRDGVFGIVRHPMYLSEILLYLSFLLFYPSLAAACIWGLAIGFFHVIARYEERKLLAHFGDEYRDYMEEVPMWWPRMGRTR